MSSEEASPEKKDPIYILAEKMEALAMAFQDVQMSIDGDSRKLESIEKRISILEQSNTASVSDLRTINRKLSGQSSLTYKSARSPESEEQSYDSDNERQNYRKKKKEYPRRSRRSTVWDAIDGKLGEDSDEEPVYKIKSNPTSRSPNSSGVIALEPTIEYPKDKVKTRSIGGLLKLAEYFAEMETMYKGRYYVPAKLVDQELKTELCTELGIELLSFTRLSAKQILQAMVTLVRPKTQKEYMQAYERYAKINLPDSVPKLLSTRPIMGFYNLIYGPILEVLNKFQRLYDILREDANDKMKDIMPREEWGHKEEPQLFSALFNAFGALNQPLLSRVKLREVKKCNSLDELISLIRKLVNADKKASDAEASVCIDYGQDVKGIHRTSNRILSTMSVVHYTDGTSDEDEDEYHSLPPTPATSAGDTTLVHPAPDECELPKSSPEADGSDDDDGLQAFTPKPTPGSTPQQKGCLSFYRNKGKCINLEKRGKCDFSHDPVDILKLHEEMEEQKKSPEFRTFMENVRNKAKAPQRPGVTFGPRATKQFSSDLVRSSPGANAAAKPSFEKKLYLVDKMQSEDDENNE